MGRVKQHRVLVLAANDWNDRQFLQEELLRLGSIHRKIRLIFPDDTCPWQIYLHDWCKTHPDQFIAAGYPKDVFQFGTGEDEARDWRMFWTEEPDEVWKIESSKGCKGRPNYPLWPALWDTALAMNMECVVFRAPYAKNGGRHKPGYMVPAKIVRKRKII